jgi:dUTP pyrophosphatase
MYGTVSIDVEKNVLHNINFSKGSHTKVYVICTRCKESFLRERRGLHRRHHCSSFRSIDGVQTKWCNTCCLFKPMDDFNANRGFRNGVDATCRECKKKKQFNDRWSTFEKYIDSTVKLKISHSKHEGMECDIDSQFLKNQWEKQNGLCYYTGIPMVWSNKKSLHSCSVERLDCTKGYIKTNTVWCCLGINTLKNTKSVKEFFDFMGLVDLHRTPVRIEHQLIHPDAKTPSRTRDTDAGHDLYSIEHAVIKPGTTMSIRTGIVMVVPRGFYMTVEGRSSLFKHGIIPARGIIDATYTGEMIVSLTNQSYEDYEIRVGDRIAQLITHRCYDLDIAVVEEISPEYNIRGMFGFGSSGR